MYIAPDIFVWELVDCLFFFFVFFFFVFFVFCFFFFFRLNYDLTRLFFSPLFDLFIAKKITTPKYAYILKFYCVNYIV